MVGVFLFLSFFLNLKWSVGRRGDPVVEGAQDGILCRQDERLQLRFVDQRGGVLRREPGPPALALLGPTLQFFQHVEREHLDPAQH